LGKRGRKMNFWIFLFLLIFASVTITYSFALITYKNKKPSHLPCQIGDVFYCIINEHLYDGRLINYCYAQVTVDRIVYTGNKILIYAYDTVRGSYTLDIGRNAFKTQAEVIAYLEKKGKWHES
jgi:hypothetical protein